MEIPKKLKDEIWEYCKINEILNFNEFVLKLLTQGFTIEKFGATPNNKIVEKIIEVPVDKIVEKEVYVTDDVEIKKLTDEINELRKTVELNKIELENKNIEIQSLIANKQQANNSTKKDIYGEN